MVSEKMNSSWFPTEKQLVSVALTRSFAPKPSAFPISSASDRITGGKAEGFPRKRYYISEVEKQLLSGLEKQLVSAKTRSFPIAFPMV